MSPIVNVGLTLGLSYNCNMLWVGLYHVFDWTILKSSKVVTNFEWWGQTIVMSDNGLVTLLLTYYRYIIPVLLITFCNLSQNVNLLLNTMDGRPAAIVSNTSCCPVVPHTQILGKWFLDDLWGIATESMQGVHIYISGASVYQFQHAIIESGNYYVRTHTLSICR